jgi:hypothetical protein
MADLHVVTEQDIAAAVEARDWAGPSVPPGHTVQTGYVPIENVVCHAPFGHQLLPAEVERAYRRQLELGDQQAWPPPTGYWREDQRFMLTDGRNRFMASLMLGGRAPAGRLARARELLNIGGSLTSSRVWAGTRFVVGAAACFLGFG